MLSNLIESHDVTILMMIFMVKRLIFVNFLKEIETSLELNSIQR